LFKSACPAHRRGASATIPAICPSRSGRNPPHIAGSDILSDSSEIWIEATIAGLRLLLVYRERSGAVRIGEAPSDGGARVLFEQHRESAKR